MSIEPRTPPPAADGVAAHPGPPPGSPAADSAASRLAAQCRQAPALAAVLLGRDRDGAAAVVAMHPRRPPGAQEPPWVGVARGLFDLSAGAEAVPGVDGAHGSPWAWRAVSVPGAGLYREGGRWVVGAALPSRDDRQGGLAAYVVQCRQQELPVLCGRLASCWLALDAAQERSDADRLRSAARWTTMVLEVLGALSRHATFRELGRGLCDETSARLGCDRVAVGLVTPDGRHVRVRAMSHTDKLAPGSHVLQSVELAMEEAVDQDDIVTVPPAGGRVGIVSRAAGELSASGGAAAVAAVPVRSPPEPTDARLPFVAGRSVDPSLGVALRPRGAITLERGGGRPFTPEELDAVRVLVDVLALRLVASWRADRWIGARALAEARRGLAALLGPDNAVPKAVAAVAVAAAAFLAFARGTYHVGGTFRLVAARDVVVAAPFDGTVRSVAARVGDRVSAGQTMAVLDSSQTRLELAEARGELAVHEKDAAVARDQAKLADEQVAAAKARQVRARIDLLEDRVSRATLVAPADGVVLAGDLDKAVGGPVREGQTLFELAPLDELYAEIGVPEEQIADVTAGQRGELAAAALPWQRVPVTVELVEPLAQVADTRNVFKVRAALGDRSQWMRPGMEGVARIDAGRRRYAWIWTRPVLNWFRMKLWL